MKDSVRVQVFQGMQNLKPKALNFNLREPFSSFQHFIKGLVCAHLKQDVNVLMVFEKVLEAYDIRVLQRSVDANLTHQLNIIRF